MPWHGIDVGQRSAAIFDEQTPHRALTQSQCSMLHRHAVRPESDQARSSPVATAAAAWPAATAQAVPAAPKSRGSPLVPWRLLKAPSTACGHRSRWSCQACRLKEHRSRERDGVRSSGLRGRMERSANRSSSQCVSSSRWPLREFCVTETVFLREIADMFTLTARPCMYTCHLYLASVIAEE